MSIHRSIVALIGLVCLTFVCGCQMGGSPPAPAMDTSKALLISSGNGASVLYLTSTDGTVHSVGSDGAHACKQCEADAADYFKTGHIDPVCSACGAHRTVLSSTWSSGHQ